MNTYGAGSGDFTAAKSPRKWSNGAAAGRADRPDRPGWAILTALAACWGTVLNRSFLCYFNVKVSGEDAAVNTRSRSGKLTLALTDAPLSSVEVQIGPVYRAVRRYATAIAA